MGRIDQNLSETDIRSPKAKFWAVRADTSDPRPWLRRAFVCPTLAHYQIVHLGFAEMPHPFRIVRAQLSGSYFLACTGGSGRVLIDGRWKSCSAGQAFLLPPGTRHAFHATARSIWRFVWVRYQEVAGQRPLALIHSPILAQFAAKPLQHAVLGLVQELQCAGLPGSLTAWLDLIQQYVHSFAQPAGMDPRLHAMWEHVAADLQHPWSSAEMALGAHISEKHLERLCRLQLGRTPRQHLIWLRMRRAAELLATGQRKIESVASEVGYQNPFVFSTTFKRFMGWPPSQYPGRKGN